MRGPLNSYCHCQEKSYLRTNWTWGAALSSTINLEIGWRAAFKSLLQVVPTWTWDLQLSEPQFSVWINLLIILFQFLLSLLSWFWIVKPPVLKQCYTAFSIPTLWSVKPFDHAFHAFRYLFPPKRLWLNLSGQGLGLVIHHHQIKYSQAWVNNTNMLTLQKGL